MIGADFIHIQDWMLEKCDGDLQKAALYALIFRHSQDGCCKLTYDYERMSGWCGGVSVSELDELLDSLVEKELIRYDYPEGGGYARFSVTPRN